MCIFHAPHAANQFVLDVKWQAGADAVGVDLMGGQAFGFQKNLVTLFVSEAVDLVLHTRAIAWANPFNLAREHRTAVKAGADDLVCACIGMRDPAGHLMGMHACIAHEAEHWHRGIRPRHTIAGLLGALAVVDAASVNARGRAGLQSPLRKLEFLKPSRQTDRRWVPRPARLVVVQPDMDTAIQKGAGGQHHRTAAKTDTDLRNGTNHAVPFHHQVVHRLLKQPQIRLVFQHASNRSLVQNAVCLRTSGTHSRTFGAIEYPKLDAALVCCQRHRTAECIHLFHQMTFANATDAGVATHLAERLNVVGQQQSLTTHARRSQGRFCTGMATAHHDHVKVLGVVHSAPAFIHSVVNSTTIAATQSGTWSVYFILWIKKSMK